MASQSEMKLYFDGKNDVDSFIAAIELQAKRLNVKPHALFAPSVAKSILRAAEFEEAPCPVTDDEDALKKFTDFLKKTYSKEDNVLRAAKELWNASQKAGESVREFSVRLRALAVEAKEVEKVKADNCKLLLELFVAGLRPGLRERIASHGRQPNGYQEMVEVAIKLEEELGIASTATSSLLVRPPAQSTGLEIQYQAASKSRKGKPARFEAQQRGSFAKSGVICEYCARRNHSMKDCREYAAKQKRLAFAKSAERTVRQLDTFGDFSGLINPSLDIEGSEN
jgi:hypothetical protein